MSIVVESKKDDALPIELSPKDLEHTAANLPPFSEYDAEQQLSWSDNTVSHDPHLNTDGEALYRFLLQQAKTPPRFVLKICGTHEETDHGHVTTHMGGHTAGRKQRPTETIVDFSFQIDLAPSLSPGYEMWSLPDSEPAYRGKMFKEVAESGVRRAASEEEKDAASAWQAQRKLRGVAPWTGQELAQSWNDGVPNMDDSLPKPDLQPLKSSHTLRQLADEYCASDRVLKEFVFDENIYGWDFDSVITAIREAVEATGYRHTIHIDFNREGHKVSIRPSTRLSRALSSLWLKALLWILLIYPFVWLFKRYNSHGGGVWRIYGVAYSLSRRPEHQPTDGPDGSRNFAQARVDELNGTGDVDGMRASFSGLKEGEWFRVWDATIRQNVIAKLRTSRPLAVPHAPVAF